MASWNEKVPGMLRFSGFLPHFPFHLVRPGIDFCSPSRLPYGRVVRVMTPHPGWNQLGNFLHDRVTDFIQLSIGVHAPTRLP